MNDTLVLDEKVKVSIRNHAEKEFGDGSAPKECCGVVIVRQGRQTYYPCRNLSTEKDRFSIDPVDYSNAEDLGEVVCIVHSHPYMPSAPSQADLIGCENSGLPWAIVSWPNGDIYQFNPTGYRPSLIGRQFVHGVLDCYSLIRDYYREVLNIEIPDFKREEFWWEKNQNLYMDNFKSAGFIEVPDGLNDLRLHDGLLMQVSSPVVNHAAVYIGDNTIMHHFMNRLSSRDVLGSSLRRTVIKVVRHRELLNA